MAIYHGSSELRLHYILEYLEAKVMYDEASNSELRLYQDYMWFGEKVFYKIKYVNIVNNIIEELEM